MRDRRVDRTESVEIVDQGGEILGRRAGIVIESALVDGVADTDREDQDSVILGDVCLDNRIRYRIGPAGLVRVPVGQQNDRLLRAGAAIGGKLGSGERERRRMVRLAVLLGEVVQHRVDDSEIAGQPEIEGCAG